jgi:hypothetical protein
VPVPTFTHSKSSVFKIQDAGNTTRDVSNVTTKCTLARMLDKAETSAFGSTYKSYVPGLTDASFQCEMEFDQTVIGYLDGILGNPSRTFEYDPIGTAATTPKYTGALFISQLTEASDITAEVKCTVDFQIVGTVTVGAN